MIMDYKELFALVKGMLVECLKGMPVDENRLITAIHNIELAIDRAIVLGVPTSDLESMRNELLTVSEAVWYADRRK